MKWLTRCAVLLVAPAVASCASSGFKERNPDEPPAVVAPAAPPSAAATPAPATAKEIAAANTFDESAVGEPKGFAARFPHPVECETQARKLKAKNAKLGWDVLKACVERGKFTALQRITDGTWDAELKRADGAQLLLKVMAARGGDVNGDLTPITARKIPLFALASALEQPDVYKGRLVVVRGELAKAKSEGGKMTVMLSEKGMGASTSDQEVGSAYTTRSNYNSSGKASVDTTRYGSARASGSYQSSNDSRSATTKKRFENVEIATGRQALLRLSAPDPFLAPGKDFLVLARFEGVRKMASDETEDSDGVAILTVVMYEEPSALMLE